MKAAIKILVVDDVKDCFLVIKKLTADIKDQHCTVDWCSSYTEAKYKILNRQYDLYFVDYNLGSYTGLDLIRSCVKQNCEEPIVLLTESDSRILDMEAIESGAIDYLVKTELSVEYLERCIRYSLGRSSALKALKNNEQKFRSIFERSKDTVFIASQQLFFTEVNDASFLLLGYEREALLQMNLYQLLADNGQGLTIQEELANSGLVDDMEVNLLTNSGSTKTCIITLSAETNADAEVYVQGIIHEITSLKRAEKATLALEKLKMASRLTRIMAHEVRNPLNNIMLSVEQLKPELQNDELGIYLDIMSRNCKRIGDIVTELLNSSRPSEIIAEKKSLQFILNESIAAANDRISLRNIQMEKEFMNGDAWVMADADKLKIAFLNIIINAVESMQTGEGKLTVSVRSKNNIQYEVSIQDNGCGISNENLMKLFEPYFTTKQNGVGLGLASALNILQSHNASIDVDSKLQQGTTFRLFFNKA